MFNLCTGRLKLFHHEGMNKIIAISQINLKNIEDDLTKQIVYHLLIKSSYSYLHV